MSGSPVDRDAGSRSAAGEAGSLTAHERERYARHLLVPEVGTRGQEALRRARVLVVGAGGLGSPVLLYLAAAGVGTIGVVDDDVVELTNLQRQVVHGEADLGRPKVDSVVDRLREVNPTVVVRPHRLRLGQDTASDLIAEYDIVVDGTDNFPTRYVVADACALAGVPLVWASVLRFEGQVSVWWAGHGPCYRCVFPRPPAPGEVPSCSESGVLGVLPGIIGAVQASEAIKLITGIGQPLVGRLLLHDALAASWDTLDVRANPSCPVCGSGAVADAESVAALESGAACEVRADSAGEAPVPLVGARELATLLGAGEPLVLVDVRTDGEREIVAIPGDRHVPLDRLESAVEDLVGRDVVVYCKAGTRSAQAVRRLRASGVEHVRSLDGGVLAWVDNVNPRLARY